VVQHDASEEPSVKTFPADEKNDFSKQSEQDDISEETVAF